MNMKTHRFMHAKVMCFWISNATVPDAPRVRLMLMSARNLVVLDRFIIPKNQGRRTKEENNNRTQRKKKNNGRLHQSQKMRIPAPKHNAGEEQSHSNLEHEDDGGELGEQHEEDVEERWRKKYVNYTLPR